MVCALAMKLTVIGDHYDFRTWIEYGLKQAKDTLGWADFRMTGELVISAFLMVSLFADQFNQSCPLAKMGRCWRIQ